MSYPVLMIRPVSFGFNEQTSESNAFQVRNAGQANVQHKAEAEFDTFVDKLRSNGIDVIVIDDTLQPHTPDSIFPNNWISFHQNGTVFVYPMQAENRRSERRADVIEELRQRFAINELIDLSHFEQQNLFLEGTGSMVLDRENKIAYACLSPRTSVEVMETFCKKSGYTPVYFHAIDTAGKAIYHTNVLMCMGSRFVVICLEAVTNQLERQLLLDKFNDTQKELISISMEQMNNFAGNMLEVVNAEGEHLLIMSARAYGALNTQQINALQKYCRIVYSDLQTIENNGGGSARCMMAEVCLPLLK